jgi:hypothetical protein
MDDLMREIAGRRPLVTSNREVDPLSSLPRTLRKHYDAKRRRYGLGHPSFYDADLKRLFSDAPRFAGNPLAAQFLVRIRKDVREVVSTLTGAYQYTIDQVLEEMMLRCRELKLRLRGPANKAQLDFTVLLTMHTMNYLHRRSRRVAL